MMSSHSLIEFYLDFCIELFLSVDKKLIIMIIVMNNQNTNKLIKTKPIGKVTSNLLARCWLGVV